MDPQDQQATISEDEQQAIITVAERALEFGMGSARSLTPEDLEDPVLHTYYLLYVFGALEWLGDNLDPARPLPYPHKLAAMTEALGRFGTTDRESTRATVMMLHNAGDEAALRVRAAGAESAQRWHARGDAAALDEFAALRDDPDALPREVAAVRPDGPTTH